MASVSLSIAVFLQNLPVDIVLADRGFDKADSFEMYQPDFIFQPSPRGKNQLTALEVEETRSIADVWIHVERIIGMVRQKYTILQDTLPVDCVITRIVPLLTVLLELLVHFVTYVTL